MSNVCFGWAGRLFGHNYEPRFSDGKPTFPPDMFHIADWHKAAIIEASKARTYHGDTCTRCGHTVNAPKKD